MSAKHKRPFYVFAAVAVVCSMVLVTGVRGSRAEDGRAPVLAGSAVTSPGSLIAPVPTGSEAAVPDSDDGAPGSSGTGPQRELEVGSPEPDDSLAGGDPAAGPASGVIVLPRFDFPLPPVSVTPGDVIVPPGSDEGDRKGRGEHRGKKGKNKDKGGDQSEEAEADSEEEVDPNVYSEQQVEGEEPTEFVEEAP